MYGVLHLCLREGNDLDLDVCVLGQRLDRNAAPRGLVGEVLLVLAVHLLGSQAPLAPTHPIHWCRGTQHGDAPQSRTCRRGRRWS